MNEVYSIVGAAAVIIMIIISINALTQEKGLLKMNIIIITFCLWLWYSKWFYSIYILETSSDL